MNNGKSNLLIRSMVLGLLLCCAVSGTVRTWNGTDFGGTIATTDTLRWDATSVTNWTATGNLTIAHAIIDASYTGNWSAAGYSITLTNGGLTHSGTGSFTPGTAFTFDGSGTFYIASTAGTLTSTGCVITFNGNDDTLNVNKTIVVKSLINNGKLFQKSSISLTLSSALNYVPLTFGANSVFYGNGTGSGAAGLLCNFSVSPTTAINIHPTAKLEAWSYIGITAVNTSGNITIPLPKIITETMSFNFATRYGGTCTVNATDTFYCKNVGMYSNTVGGATLTFNANGHPFSAEGLDAGGQFAGGKVRVNLQNIFIDVRNIISSKAEVDSTIFDFTGSQIQNSNIVLKPLQRIDGSPTFLQTNDLFMGHSMLVGVWYRNVAHHFEKNYRGKVYVNKAITGSSVTNVNSRVDSCLDAYNPTRFYLWTGTNDLNYDDETQFNTAMAMYFTNWTQIISKVKTHGVDSIYIADMPPRGTAAAPMSSSKQANFIRFNSALKDSCRTNGLYFISTYDSLLESGYTDRISTEYSTDGLHPNFTLAGAQYCGYLFSQAQWLSGSRIIHKSQSSTAHTYTVSDSLAPFVDSMKVFLYDSVAGGVKTLRDSTLLLKGDTVFTMTRSGLASNTTYFYWLVGRSKSGTWDSSFAVRSVKTLPIKWPVGTRYVIPMTVNKLKIGEAVTSFTYKGELVLTNEQKFKSNFSSAANITIFDTITELQRPTWIYYISANKDTVKFYFNGPTVTSVNKAFCACAGSGINRVNSASTFADYTNWWGLNENGGSTTADYVGGVTGTVVNPATIGNTSAYGYAANFTGTGGGRITTTSKVVGIGDVSVSFLVNMRSTGESSAGRLCSNGSFMVQSNGLALAFKSNGSTGAISSSISLNTWYHCAATRTSTGITNIYINGVLSGSANQTGGGTPVVGTDNFMIGNITTVNRSFDGLVKDLSVSNGIMSTGVISTDYEQIMNPSTFWTQGTSFSVGSGGGNIFRLFINRINNIFGRGR